MENRPSASAIAAATDAALSRPFMFSPATSGYICTNKSSRRSSVAVYGVSRRKLRINAGGVAETTQPAQVERGAHPAHTEKEHGHGGLAVQREQLGYGRRV